MARCQRKIDRSGNTRRRKVKARRKAQKSSLIDTKTSGGEREEDIVQYSCSWLKGRASLIIGSLKRGGGVLGKGESGD